MKPPIGIVALLVLSAGCAGQNRWGENAQLKARVSALETEVADLRAENTKLTASAQTPVAIDGLKLEAPKFGELRFTPVPPTRTYTGPTHVIAAGGNDYTDAVTFTGQNITGSGKIAAGTLIIRNESPQTGSITIQKAAATTTTTSTTPAITPHK